MKQKEIRYYINSNGKAPFEDWITKIKDPQMKARIFRRLDRMVLGNYGDHKSLGEGIYELRLAFGSGYRIYFAEEGDFVVILLIAGDKSTQVTDIATAKKLWRRLKSENHD